MCCAVAASTPYKHNHTSVSLLRHHFVFVPKRRRKILVGPLAERLEVLLREKTGDDSPF